MEPGFRTEEQVAYSIADVARRTGASETAVRRWIERGYLPARRLGKRRLLVLRGDLERYLEGLPHRGNAA